MIFAIIICIYAIFVVSLQRKTETTMKMSSTFNIIGDIHGRTCWKDLVREDSVNIFVGDYFDPYEEIPVPELLYNFHEIIAYKREHPETVLLYGNHDLHYLISSEHYSRYNYICANEYWHTFLQTQDLFTGVAYAIGNKALVSHAGVSKAWYQKYFGVYHGEALSVVAAKINRLWTSNKDAFAFEPNATDWLDYCGTSPTHSPMWIRPRTLVKHDLFADTEVKQIVGHTQTEAGVMFDHNIVLTDCLGFKAKSFVFEF